MPQQFQEYVYYEATLIVGVHTPRLQPAPATVFLAGNIHAEIAAKVRSALREYRTVEQTTSGLSAYLPTSQGLPLYGIRKLQPMGAPRSVDEDFNLEITSLRFAVGIAMPESTFAANDAISLALERNVEKAAKDLFAALAIPCAEVTIPGDEIQLGPTYIDVMCELGPATEIGLVTVP